MYSSAVNQAKEAWHMGFGDVCPMFIPPRKAKGKLLAAFWFQATGKE